MVVENEDPFSRKILLAFNLVMDQIFFLSNHSSLYGATFVGIRFLKLSFRFQSLLGLFRTKFITFWPKPAFFTY